MLNKQRKMNLYITFLILCGWIVYELAYEYFSGLENNQVIVRIYSVICMFLYPFWLIAGFVIAIFLALFGLAIIIIDAFKKIQSWFKRDK